MVLTTEIGNRSREGLFSGNYGINRTRNMSNSRLRSESRASTNRDRIRCYNVENMIILQETVPPLEEEI